MWWRRRTTTEPAELTDYGGASERHRLADGDVVPVPGYRRFADLLNDDRREPPVVDVNDSIPTTPAREHRSGHRRWLR